MLNLLLGPGCSQLSPQFDVILHMRGTRDHGFRKLISVDRSNRTLTCGQLVVASCPRKIRSNQAFTPTFRNMEITGVTTHGFDKVTHFGRNYDQTMGQISVELSPIDAMLDS